MEHLNHKKGQGATEYLVLLAVVLIVAMVAIALLGFFPGMATDAKIGQSRTYWSGQATPFAILEHTQNSSAGAISFVLQNIEADQRAINNITVYGSGLNGTFRTTTLASSYFSGGEKKKIDIPLSAGTVAGTCTSGSVYEYSVNISFNNSDNSLIKLQVGSKTLIGKCA